MSELDDLDQEFAPPSFGRTWHQQRVRRALAEFCRNGHHYDEANTVYSKKGKDSRRVRRCKACDRAAHGFKGIYKKEKL